MSMDMPQDKHTWYAEWILPTGHLRTGLFMAKSEQDVRDIIEIKGLRRGASKRPEILHITKWPKPHTEDGHEHKN